VIVAQLFAFVLRSILKRSLTLFFTSLTQFSAVQQSNQHLTH